MELKFHKMENRYMSTIGSNRTFMELKSRIKTFQKEIEKSSNRTFMELKLEVSKEITLKEI